MSFQDTFRRLTAPILDRVKAIAVRGTVTQTDQAKRAPELQTRLLAGEVRDQVEHAELYGFSSHMPVGTEVIVIALGGNRDHAVAVAAMDRANRPTGLAEGEVEVYNGVAGTRVLLKADGTIEITGTSTVSIEGDVTVSGDLDVTGRIEAGLDVVDLVGSMNIMRSQFNAHTHQENGDGGGVTNPPIPQQT